MPTRWIPTVPDRVPVLCIVPLEDGFQVKLTVPLGLNPTEAHRIKSVVDDYTTDIRTDAKFLAADPSISIGITE